MEKVKGTGWGQSWGEEIKGGRGFLKQRMGWLLSSIPIDIVKSITVFKPPVPVWLGAGASDGAIVITTRDSVDFDADESKHVTRICGAGGSYGQAEGTVSHRAASKTGSAMVTAGGDHRDGKRTNSDRDSGNFSLHWDRELSGERRVELDGRYYLSGSFTSPVMEASIRPAGTRIWTRKRSAPMTCQPNTARGSRICFRSPCSDPTPVIPLPMNGVTI